ncbi:MFS transporter [Methanomethylovorans sp.]|uniref:MFS transporter n=1 Tax=Methanomethylovorans sp. TaxID=2758717 RepID=UPI000AB25027|nr:MFS transporter [Methanomethylovorans sp.]
MILNLVQFLTNSSLVMSGIFIPVFARSLGVSYFEVGLISAFFSAASFFSSFIFGKSADSNRLRPIILSGLAVSAVSLFMQVFAYNAASLATIRAMVGFSVGVYPAALIVSVYYEKGSIGKFSSFGSLGWMAGYLIAGFIGNIEHLFVLSSLFFTIAFLAALGLTDAQRPSISVSYFSLDVLRNNLDVYLSMFLRHMGAVAVWIILPLYMIFLDASNFWIGIIYAINPFIQFIVMRRLDKFRNEWLIKWGIIISGLSFISYSLAQDFCSIVLGMILIAFGWSFLYVGANQLVVERSIEKASSAGILNSTTSAADIAGSIIGGLIMQYFGFKQTMMFAVICSILAMMVFSWMNRPSHKSSI